MGNQESAGGALRIPENNNLVKVVVLGSNDVFKSITQKLSTTEEGDSLLPELGIDIRRSKMELRKQQVHRMDLIPFFVNFFSSILDNRFEHSPRVWFWYHTG